MAEPLLAFRPGLELQEQEGGGAELLGLMRPVRVDPESSTLLALLRRLAGAPATESELRQDTTAGGEMAELYYYLARLDELAALSRTVCAAGQPLARFVPLVAPCCFEPLAADGGTAWRLSRFAYLHCAAEQLVLESPLGKARVFLMGGRAAELVAALSAPHTVAELGGLLDRPDAEAAIQLLVNAQALTAVGVDGIADEDRSRSLRAWDFHDLLFHTRTRLGRMDGGWGGTYRFRGELEPLPLTGPPPAAGEAIDLFRPDIQRLTATDEPLTSVLERRRSVRAHDDPRPVTAEQLGELLYRTARLTEGDTVNGVELGRFPYPNAGGCAELTVYVSVNTCDGLDPALYKYDSGAHRLCRISGCTKEVEALLGFAAASAGRNEPPQVLLTVSARFGRIAWKYESIAYSLVLKNVGALLQTLYLVATAMHLAPCAIGGGNADIFAAAAGLDYYAETSVGEFMVGSLAPIDD